MGGEGGERGNVRGRRNWEERRKEGGLETVQRSEDWKWGRKGREKEPEWAREMRREWRKARTRKVMWGCKG
jgi:hypothetical protein